MKQLSSTTVQLLLLVVVFFLFSPALQYDFVWDDNVLVLGDKSITEEASVSDFLTTPFGPLQRGTQSSYYRPLVSISFWLDYLIGGGSPAAFHLTNIMLHVLVCVLMYILLLRLNMDRFVSFAATAIFALHPLHVPSVAWISGRGDLLASAFILLALILYLANRENDHIRFKIGFFLALVAALASKETAVLTPALIALVALFQSGWSFRTLRRNIDKTLLITSVITVILFMLWHQQVTASDDSAMQISFSLDIERMLVLFSHYSAALFFPFGLSIMYFTLPSLSENATAWFWLALPATVFFFALRKGVSSLVFALLWTCICLLPVLGIAKLQSEYVAADHLAYTASIGAALVMGLVVQQAGKFLARFKSGFSFDLIVLTALLVVFGTFTVLSMSPWRNEHRLFGFLTQRYPATAAPWYGLSLLAIRKGDYRTAKEYLLEAAKDENAKPEVFNNLGNIFYSEADYSTAATYYLQALEKNPGHVESIYNLGDVYRLSGKRARAAEYYRRFIAAAPSDFAGSVRKAKQALREMGF